MLFTLTAEAAGRDFKIHTFDSNQSSPRTTQADDAHLKLSSDAAMLLLARRYTWPESSPPIGDVDEETIQQLNKFGGRQQIPFADHRSLDFTPKLLLVLDGPDQNEINSLPTDLYPSLTFSDPAFSIDKLPNQNGHRDASDSKESCIYFDYDRTGCSHSAGAPAHESDEICSTGEAYDRFLTCDSSASDIVSFLEKAVIRTSSFKRVRFTLTISSRHGENVALMKDGLESLMKGLQTLAVDFLLESTVVLGAHDSSRSDAMNLMNHISSKAKRDSADSAVQSESKGSTKAQQKQQHATRNSHVARAESSPVLFSSPKSPIHIPICYNTNATCVEGTNSCSGHGHCYRKRSSGSKSEKVNDCYACKCSRTVVRKNSDGTVKTVQWGGPDCSKKDISMHFWLIGGLSIFLIYLVAYGIGLLFSIGSEELPSVLSAGVAPPKGQK
ncbi:hypothetical protein FQN57_005787 [Myotisia sp. PD_48]|nr:hypothetical protein FQN57_005787 [Myotisia sp. PD_48]